MPNHFDAKTFNAEVFQAYMARIENPNQTALIKSKAIRQRPDLAALAQDQVGGNIIVSPLLGLISGQKPLNYDGKTDITSDGTVTYYQNRVVVGRSKGWTENDFASDITGGEDFMENVAAQISDYKYEIDQDTLLYIMKGVFSMTSAEGQKFVTAHTHDITAVQNSEGKTGLFDATTMNTAMQKACGDKKSKFTLAIMHSSVATNLENLKLLTYAKYNDGHGMEREIQIATVNGRLVLIDDAMPVNTAGDNPVYTTYVFGDGAIEHTDCGAKVPIEMFRDPKTNGGQDTLYMRQRKSFAPWGITFTKASMASPSPTDEELAMGTNWDIVNGQDKDGKTVYIPLKTIPLCQILSLG